MHHLLKLFLSMLFLCFLMIVHAAQLDHFDTSGMPAQPTNFAEQALWDLIQSHPEGDLPDAIRIHEKLARYYAEKGDSARAAISAQNARKAEEALASKTSAAEAPPVSSMKDSSTGAASPASAQGSDAEMTLIAQAEKPPTAERTTDFSGNYYCAAGGALETWDFHPDGTFYHVWAASGAGTSVRNSEKGTFRIENDSLELRIDSTAGGYVTPTAGGRETAIGGGSDSRQEVRQVKIKRTGEGRPILLDGREFKIKSW